MALNILMPRTIYIVIVLVALYVTIFVLSVEHHGADFHFVLACAAIAPILIALTTIDIFTFRLPDPLNLLLFCLGFAFSALVDPENLTWNFAAAVLGLCLLVAVDKIYAHIRERPGLGLGDAKLYGAAGMWVGLDGLASTLLIACTSAIVAVLLAVMSGRKVQSSTPLPFGPFLCLGFWTTWNFGPTF
jgi:leader peptidase (prepilin peptidase)/N-methyltransferase